MDKEKVVDVFMEQIGDRMSSFNLYLSKFRWTEASKNLTVYFSRKPPFTLPHWFACEGQIISVFSEIDTSPAKVQIMNPEKAPSERPIKIEPFPWEDGEMVITVNGRPVGRTLSKNDAAIVNKWLKTSIREILEILTLTNE